MSELPGPPRGRRRNAGPGALTWASAPSLLSQAARAEASELTTAPRATGSPPKPPPAPDHKVWRPVPSGCLPRVLGKRVWGAAAGGDTRCSEHQDKGWKWVADEANASPHQLRLISKASALRQPHPPLVPCPCPGRAFRRWVYILPFPARGTASRTLRRAPSRHPKQEDR